MKFINARLVQEDTYMDKIIKAIKTFGDGGSARSVKYTNSHECITVLYVINAALNMITTVVWL
jgi:hypothetical protein